MEAVTVLKNGDRVKVKPDRADGFLQPWRDRFTKGREGTVIDATDFGCRVLVEWDAKGRARYPSDFRLPMSLNDLMLVELKGEDE